MSQNNKFSTNNFLKEKMFVGTETITISKEEFGFMEDVLSKSSVEKNGFEVSEIIKSLKLIDQNYEYDSYSFSFDNKNFVLKVNEDDVDCILKREYENLKLLEGKPISPIPMFFEQVIYSDSKINILIVTLEESLSLFDVSEMEFFQSLEPLAMNFSYLHEITQGKKDNEVDMFVNCLFEDNDFEEIVPEDIIQKFKNKITNYEKYSEILSLLKSGIKEEIKLLDQSDFSLCHTNLTKSRILFRNNFFKFINFQYSFFLDPFFDIALLVLSTGICKDKQSETEFLEKYLKHHRSLNISIEEAIEKLNKFKQVCCKISLIRLSSEMVFELSIHQDKRPNRILKTIKKYEYIRPLIEKEYKDNISVIDDFFYLFK